ncbi:recombinase family protein, partial [Patescibacteria group bacterium]|nr:recombinase family protein [Patescibacteria group bacterium]
MNSEQKKVAIYARVSSDRQDIDLSVSAQLKALREYAIRNGQRVVKEYIDEAESGRSIDRPGFKQMIVAARQKPAPFMAILVWKLSRFARNREDSIIYKSLLRKQGIQVVSINEPVEDTPSGRLLEGIIEVIDEFYSANLSQDVLRGMKENAGRGFCNGGRAPYGYIRVKVQDGDTPRTKLEPDPKTAPIIQRIFRECFRGKGLKTIARELNADGLLSSTGKKWGATSIEKIVRNEAYTGVLVWGKRPRVQSATNSIDPLRIEDAWVGLIDRTLFDEVQVKLAARAPQAIHPREVDSPY